ncbi:MAG: (2E,6E)-farnesyl diphosphate synthase [Colwellia sp.]
MNATTNLASLATSQSRINDFLLAKVNELPVNDVKLLEAIKYGLLLGGKRMRPYLAYITGETLGASISDIDAVAAALECIHAYSLIHDDLPAMDDDDLRRGKPTCHIAFDEATAILAGDSLQTLAFDILTNHQFSVEIQPKQITLIKQLVSASGYQGMCGGQALDLAATNQKVDLNYLESLHSLKTGALLEASVLMAATCSPEVDQNTLEKLKLYAKYIGLAYQVQDDIIDITSTQEQLGKTKGSDLAANKSTYPSLLGLQGAQDKAEELFQLSLQALTSLPYNTQSLEKFATFIVKRSH